MFYAVIRVVTVGGSPDNDAIPLALMAFTYFVAPLTIAYAINVNLPSSRYLIVGFVVLLMLQFLNDWMFPRLSPSPAVTEVIATSLALIVIIYWLFQSKKMRYYYAAISDQPIPEDLVGSETGLLGDSWISDEMRLRLDWIISYLEVLVILGFIFIAIYAVATTSP